MTVKFLAVALISFSAALSAQSPGSSQTSEPAKGPRPMHTAMDRQPDSENDIEMQNWIIFGGKTVDRLISLGVERRIAESINSAPTDEGTAFVTWKTARIGAKERSGLLFLPCHAGWDSAYLFALARQDKSWLVTDHLEMDCHYDDSVSFEVARIRDPDHDEVLVDHACAGHGTGYLEQHFSVFTLSGGKLKNELETTEVLHSYPTAVDRPRDLDQNSTFTVVPIRGSQSRAIEETRSSVLNGMLTVQRRIFRWNAVKGRYVPSIFTIVEASPN